MFYFGADYYPEQWPEERWPEDAHLMAEAGFNVVRLAEFAWSKLEPGEGQFDFDWLDQGDRDSLDTGIQVVLGTPTAFPPSLVDGKSRKIFSSLNKMVSDRPTGYAGNIVPTIRFTANIPSASSVKWLSITKIIRQ